MPLHVAFFWHMHQPDYVDPDRRIAQLPWVRLHAAKGYYDMVRLAKEYPTVPLTFNLTPVLVNQLIRLQKNEVQDAWLELSRTPAERLTPQMQETMLKHFFSLSHDNMLRPYPRYAELWQMRGSDSRPEALQQAARRFLSGDWRDLQVWFNLAWCGYFAMRDLPALAELKKKGRGFTEADKKIILDAHLELINRVLKEYRELNLAGKIEVTTSPFYHPILPLICNTDFTRRCMPDTPLPPTFAFPEDAREHLERAVKFHEEVFGKKPTGLWPSEGSVCPEIVPLVKAAGFEWMATDEAILFRTLHMLRGDHTGIARNELFRPYTATHAGARIGMCFRDRGLSDYIGFTAAKQSASDAARFIIDSLGNIGNQNSGPDALAVVLLDGENAWQEFADGGEAFLRKIYDALANDRRFKPVTITEYFRAHPPKAELPTMHTGSWIYSNFDIWIGDAEENRAWELLRDARNVYTGLKDRLTPEAREAALQSLLAAEGSDWFWWYGPEFQIEDKPLFDELYRRHVRTAYRAMGLESPPALDKSILSNKVIRAYEEPTELITPIIDGKRTSYYEWHGSGIYRASMGHHAMAKSKELVQEIRFGFDTKNFYLYIQWAMNAPTAGADGVRFRFTSPRNAELWVSGLHGATARKKLHCEMKGEWVGEVTGTGEGIRAVSERVLEVSIPLELLGAQQPGQKLTLNSSIILGDQIIEVHPSEGGFELVIPSETTHADSWMV